MKKILLLIMMLILFSSFTTATDFYVKNYYEFDTNADDSVGSNDGVIDGATATPYGIINGAYYYDETNDVINLDDDSFETDNIGSISVWVNVTDYTNNEPIIGNTKSASLGMLRIGVLATSGKAFIQFYENPGSHNIMQTTNAVGTNAFHHIVVTSDGSTWKIYLDGTEEVLSALVGANTGQWFSDLGVGTHLTEIGALHTSNPTEWFGGVIDELLYSNTTYNQTQVTELYNGGVGYRPVVTPITTLETTLNYPTNNTHYNIVNPFNSTKVFNGTIQLTTNINANCTINDTDFSITTTGNLNQVFQNNTPLVEQNYSITVTCNNVVNTTYTNFWFILDQTDVLTSINILNNSVQANEFNLNISYFDLYLYRTNTTIIRESDSLTLYNNYSGNLGYATDTYNVLYPINLLNSTYIVGDTIKVILNGVDTHTAKKFEEKPKNVKVNIGNKNIKSYDLKKGEFRLEYSKDMEIEEDYNFDRMQFKLKSKKLKNKYTYQYVEADKIVYYENSEYPCHMIVNDKYWYDCVGMKQPKVTKERNNRYKIDFYMDSDEVITKSLGGLNEIYEEYYFTINKNYTGNIEVGDFFDPPNADFNYTSLYNFTVSSLLLTEDSITITGSNVSSYDGLYNYNLTALELEDVVLFTGATPVDCYIDLVTTAGDINTISYEWYNKTNNILESGFNLCDSDAYCTLDELSGSVTNANDSVTCRAIINDSWFNFYAISNTINTSVIGFCAGDVMYPIVNITYRDELDNNLITAVSSYNLTFFEGTSTFTFKNNNTGNYTQFCTDTNVSFNLNMYGNLILSSPSYITRVFNIPSSEGILVSNNPYTNFSLYLIGVANSSTVSYAWQTTDYNNVDGTMQIYRCEADGSRTLIESTTVSSGQASANLQLYTTAYSYSITIGDRTYREPQYYDCHVESTQTKAYTVNILDIDVLPVIGLYLMDCHIENISATTVRMMWDGNDKDATDIEACIIGYREDIYGRNKVYESCINQSSGTLTRNIGLTGFNYYVQGSLKQNGITGMCQETVVFNQRGDTSRTIGITGIFLAALLIIALGLLAAGDNTMTILFSIIGILIIWIIGIVSFNWVIISSIIILGIIIALIGRHTLKGV